MCSCNCRCLILPTLILFGSIAAQAQTACNDDFRIFFSRDFPGSVPEYFEVEIDAPGKALYREDPEEQDPLDFQLTEEDRARLLGQVKSLDYFRVSPAHSRKVAFTGEKTFRYTDGQGKTSETKFNYTEQPDAQALTSWFLKAGETLRHRIELERAARFDRLGVNKRLLQFQVSLDRGRVVSPKQMLPILTRISKDNKIIRLSRSRAAGLVERIERGATE